MTDAKTSSRIDQLDILRGLALLGILLMNIQIFAMPGSAYVNPTAMGDFTGVNFAVWLFGHLLADSKFMAIFSILFGAGVCLFSERAQAKHGSATLAYYKRNGWLLVFGLLHGYLIWYGDILYTYALCGFWVYWFKGQSVRFLSLLSVVLLLIASLFSLAGYFALIAGLLTAQELAGITMIWAPDSAQIQTEISAYTGTLAEQFNQRFNEVIYMQTDVFYSYTLWRASGMMLLGMALYKSGVLSGQKSQGFYLRMGLGGVFGGLVLSIYGVQQNLQHDFSMEYSLFMGSQFNYWGSCLSALGYVGLVNLAINAGLAKAMQRRMAAVGQMAFTNYIMQSVLATFIFYGHGLGLFGQVERSEQLLVVVLICALQLWYSPLWLKRFRFGPLEWLWRSLTYGQKQAFKRQLV